MIFLIFKFIVRERVQLDQKGVLNGDVIDGIMMEDKKEVDKVILTGAELGKYFGKSERQESK